MDFVARLVFFFIISNAYLANAQVEITLQPFLGLRTSYAYRLVEPQQTHLWQFKRSVCQTEVGFLANVESRDKHQFTLGYTTLSDVGYRFPFVPSRFSTVQWVASTIQTSQLQLRYAHRFGFPIKWLQLRSRHMREERFLINARLEAFGGLVFERLRRVWPGDSRLINHRLAKGTDTLNYQQEIVIKNRQNILMSVGVTLQFYNREKKRLALSLYFLQGLQPYFNAETAYELRSPGAGLVRDRLVLASRGTSLGVAASYPIVFKRF